MGDVTTSTNLTAAEAPLWNTAAHHGPAVSVVSSLCIVAVVLAIAGRIVTRYATIHTLRRDDLVILGATVVAIGQSIAVSVASTDGLGSHADALDPNKIESIHKVLYASHLLYVLTLGLVKISVCIHLHGLSPIRSSHLTSTILSGIIAAWTMTSVFVVAFQCKLPQPWSLSQGLGRCVNLLAFWTYYGAINVLTDLALIVLVLPILLKLQMPPSRKAVIISCYSTRLFAVAVQILQLCYLDTLSPSSNQGTDLIYDLWKPTLLGQVVLTCSIIASCFPFLKFLIDVLETGMVRADGVNATQTHLRTGVSKGGGSSNGYFQARGSQFHKGPVHSNTEAASSETPTDSEVMSAHRISGKGEVFRMQSLHSGAKEKNDGRDGIGKGYDGDAGQFEARAYKGSDVESQSSQTHIMRKVEWSLTEEYNPGTAAI